MFSGSSSPPKDKPETIPHSEAINTPSLTVKTDEATVSQKKFSPPGGFFGRRASDEPSPGGEKKRRSSTVTKAATLFSNAKNSLSWSNSRESAATLTVAHSPPTSLHKLGRMDPALIVPQGVGVTEDRNRRCRRTMEDTHAYLYNFLGTPAPSGQADVNGKRQFGDVSPTAVEETSVVETDNGYFAIFDGHAGTFAAEWCGKKLHLILEEVMRKNPNTPVPELLDQTFTSVDQQLEKLPLKNSGCTAVIALLRWEDRVPSSHSVTGSSALAPAAAAAAGPNSEADNTPTQSAPASVLPILHEKAARQRVLYTANVGDARIILCRNGKALRLSYDHKGSDENEGKRIANAGGLILNNRVNGVLAVTRALGDAYLKDLVTGHPYTTETVIQPDQDEFIILACDGLWDVCSDQEAVDLIRNIQDAQEASKMLVDHALARFSTDNLSCMVIRFDNNRVKEVVNRTVDPIGVDGDPATHAGYGVSEADKIVEGARKSMANTEITDDAEPAEKVMDEVLQKMADDGPGPDVPIEATSPNKVGSINGST
ncbi:type 2C protein phosphatase PTC1 [Aspergillus novofumigatus IBT 16806]|uniref:PP2C-domain-containing protein n=1 Tax=Aspergillus novofumigatus (strain IBT 16806) TaxID=1392255 RepID=A0A2I1CJ29_ASPN1|nr:PP2C-domain-containing protein [Aspergillus novofumigatus IBT 16806]PKX97635.1 PP2C-domain-containing protein [Aspergillus novofumigatus IBT 16806]